MPTNLAFECDSVLHTITLQVMYPQEKKDENLHLRFFMSVFLLTSHGVWSNKVGSL